MAKLRPPLLVIAGPTASGKSALALAAARAFGGVILNADSAQVYRDLPILSAAPDAGERAAADHRLYGARDGAEPWSAAGWAEAAKAEIAAIHANGKLPILVGGTGLYLRTLLDGIAPVPPIDAEVRKAVRGASVSENLSLLMTLDPVSAARLNPGDTTRIARALEVVKSTGRTLGAWQAKKEGGIGAQVALKPLVLLPPRDWLNARCDARFAAMLGAGAVDEVRALLARNLDPALPVTRAIGVSAIAGLIDGHQSRDNAIAAGAQATRRYAKRQYTWFAHQPPADWPRFTRPLDEAGAIDEALALLRPDA